MDDTTAGDSSLGTTAGDTNGAQNPYCIACDFGRSADDFEKRFTQSWVYTLPTPFTSASNARLWRGLLGNWEWSGVFTLQSGFPVTPSVSIDNSESLEGDDRPNRVPGVPVFTAGNHTPTQWFNPAAFALSTPGTFGDAGRGILDGPGIVNIDTGLMKNFVLTEKLKLQVRAEAFNLTNRANFADPTTDVTNPLYTGKITTMATNPRQMQFSMRLSF